MCEKGLLSRCWVGEPQTHPHLPLPLPFQYSYIILQVFLLVQSLAAVLEQSEHHCSVTLPGTKPFCIAVVCLYSVRSPAALEFCLIGIGFSTDTGVPLQRFLPVVLWDLHKNNHSHFLESQLWSKFLTKMSTAEHLRPIWHKLKLEEMKIAE